MPSTKEPVGTLGILDGSLAMFSAIIEPLEAR